MSAAPRRDHSRDQRDQLSLVPTGGAVPASTSRPADRMVPELRAVPEVGEPGRELDRWRISGRPARVLTPFSATHCTGNAGLCGVCTGGPCQHDLEHQQHHHEHAHGQELDDEPDHQEQEPDEELEP